MFSIRKVSYISFLSFIILLMVIPAEGQRKMESLGRGTVAIRKNSSTVFVSWRIFGTEFNNGTTYNLYRNDTLIASNLTVSNYSDSDSQNSSYSVSAVVNSVEQPKSPQVSTYSSQVLEVPIQNIGDYYVHLAWVGDLDGDGEYEFVVDRIPNIGGVSCKVEAYKIDGTRLWQVDMGPLSLDRDGIEGGAAVISNGMWDGVTVYDLDMDGKAEVIIKSANGTVFGDGSTLTYSSDIQNFLSVLDGESGAEKSRIALPDDYLSDGPLQAQLNIAYLDGVHPSVVVKAKNRIGSGGFNLVIAAYDYDVNLTARWKWFRGNQNCPEFHQQRIADVDLDGKDEVCDGGYVIDDDGTLLYSLGPKGVVHGDRFHIGDFDPDRPGLEGYGIQQDNPSGLAWYYYDAKDGTILQTQYQPWIGDYARGNVADLEPDHDGFEMWTFTDGIYNVQDGKITNVITSSYPNLRLWWDGDVQSEMLDDVKFLNWNYNGNYEERILTASDYGAVSTWRKVPVLYGDILGDWREEVVYEKNDHSALLIFTTTIPTSKRIYTLVQNPEYRLCLTTKGYYQSAQLDYYLGYNMTTPPSPEIFRPKTIWVGNVSQSWNNTDNNWEIGGTTGSYSSGDSVLFGIQGENDTNVAVDQIVDPAITYVISSFNYTFSGSGELSGSGDLIKSGYGALNLGIKCTYSGTTRVEQGILIVDSSLSNSKVMVLGGAALGGKGNISDTCTFESRASLIPGNINKTGTLTFLQPLNLVSGLICKFDITDDSTSTINPSDKIIVQGDILVEDNVTFSIHAANEEIKAGIYPLIEYSGSLSGDLSTIKVEGLSGRKYEILDTLNSIALKIFYTRRASSITWAGTYSEWDVVNTNSWLLDGKDTTFVGGDSVIFDNTGIAQSTVNIINELTIGRMLVRGDDVNYQIDGSGVVGGEGDVIKEDKGVLQILATENTYTGKTIINGGTLIAEKINVAGFPSSIGANPSTSADQFVINNAVFSYGSASSGFTNKGITLGGQSDTIDVSKSGTTFSTRGILEGTGEMVKTGPGTLYLINSSNSYTGGTIIEGGVISINDPGGSRDIESLGSGTVTFKGGILRMGNTSDYTTCNLNFHVPEGYYGTLEADKRCNYGGKLTGEGELNIVLPGDIDRTIFRGDWSGFYGKVNVSGVSPMRLSNSLGYKNMTFKLNSGITLYYSTGTTGGDAIAQTVHIGSLEGVSSSVLKDENWIVGEANDTSTFSGVISGKSLTKEGDGMLILTNNSTYSGGTMINSGTLVANNTTGSATGTGGVTVNDGAILEGKGKISGQVQINSGGTLALDLQYGTLTINNTVTMEQGSFIRVELNSINATTAQLSTGNNNLNLDGTLVLNNTSDSYAAGDSFAIFTGTNISGIFDTILPAYPGEGLIWDTSAFYKEGILKIDTVITDTTPTPVDTTSHVTNPLELSDRFIIYPNPVKNRLSVTCPENVHIQSVVLKDLSGKPLRSKYRAESNEMDFSGLQPGVYILEIRTGMGLITNRVVKN